MSLFLNIAADDTNYLATHDLVGSWDRMLGTLRGCSGKSKYLIRTISIVSKSIVFLVVFVKHNSNLNFNLSSRFELSAA